MRYDYVLYEDGIYQGAFPIDYIDERLEIYRKYAEFLSHSIEKDEVVLYGAFLYDELSSGLLYADLMSLRIPYVRFKSLNDQLSQNCRLFFYKSRRDDL